MFIIYYSFSLFVASVAVVPVTEEEELEEGAVVEGAAEGAENTAEAPTTEPTNENEQ